MQNRTIIRTTLDIFLNNAMVRTIVSLVNFCNEQRYFYKKKLKFLQKMPINKLEASSLEDKFLFKVNR